MNNDELSSFKEKIERIEYEYLKLICNILSRKMKELSDRISDSFRYIDFIAIPMIISGLRGVFKEKRGTKRGKAYNPFYNLYERVFSYYLVEGFKEYKFKELYPGYSSNIMLEKENIILDIDIKTANIDNPSDFLGKIPLNLNEFSYIGYLPLEHEKRKISLDENLPEDIKRKIHDVIAVYPGLLSSYHINKGEIINLTYGVVIIYPSYKEKIDEIKTTYMNLMLLIEKKVNEFLTRNILECCPSMKERIEEFLSSTRDGFRNGIVISENILRAWFMHGKNDILKDVLEINESEYNKINEFINKVNKFLKYIKDNKPLPIAVIVYSVPNGHLTPEYDNQIVSGKDWGSSIRFYVRGYAKELKRYIKTDFYKLISYQDKKIPRYAFIYIDESYKEKLTKGLDELSMWSRDKEDIEWIKVKREYKGLNEFLSK